MNKSVTALIVGIAILLVMAMGVQLITLKKIANSVEETPVELGGGFPNWNLISSTATTGPFTLDGTSRQILATSTGPNGRRYVVITPTQTCDGGMYLSLANGAAATANNSMFYASGTPYVIDTSNLYTGAITGIAGSGSCSITVTAQQ